MSALSSGGEVPTRGLMVTNHRDVEFQSEIHRNRSGLHVLLMILFTLSLAGILATIVAVRSADRRGARGEDFQIDLLNDMIDVKIHSDMATTALVSYSTDLAARVTASEHVDKVMIAVNDAKFEIQQIDSPEVDKSLLELRNVIDHLKHALGDDSQNSVLAPEAVAIMALDLSESSRKFANATRDVIDRSAIGDHLSTSLRLLSLAVPTAAMLLLVALNYVRNRDMQLSYLDVRTRLTKEDRERQRIQRLALAQTNAMELIAAGAHRKEIEAEVAKIVGLATGNTWSIGPDGLSPSVIDADPLSADLALAVERILSVTSERDRSSADLLFQATHDGLTKLHNRQAVLEHISRVMQQRRDDQSIAVVYIDLDGFKYVNDTFGHALGDDTLCEVARRLESSARRGDFVARVGGDEFVAVLYPVTSSIANMIAERMSESIGHPYKVRDVTVDIGLSMGVSFANPGDTDPDVMMREADHAMYKAKRTRQRIVVADETLRQADRNRHAVEKTIGEALAGNGIAVKYQPIVDTATGRLHGVEALARLEMDGGLLAPAAFIDIAEHTGQIIYIDRRVLALACAQVAEWNRRFGVEIELAVNISAVHMSRGNSLSDLHKTLEQSGLPPELLNIEINEAIFLHDMVDVCGRIESIRRHGVKFAIDDFGTGYSSFGYLQKLPVDTLKIDKIFIDEIDHSRADRAIVKSILEVASALELNVVAEGIETPEQLEILRGLNCPLSQGYHFAKPLDSSVFEQEWFTA